MYHRCHSHPPEICNDTSLRQKMQETDKRTNNQTYKRFIFQNTLGASFLGVLYFFVGKTAVSAAPILVRHFFLSLSGFGGNPRQWFGGPWFRVNPSHHLYRDWQNSPKTILVTVFIFFIITSSIRDVTKPAKNNKVLLQSSTCIHFLAWMEDQFLLSFQKYHNVSRKNECKEKICALTFWANVF